MGKIAFVFPGQGSQYVGMTQEICAQSEAAEQIMALADEVLDFPLRTLMFQGPAEELTLTANAQPALVTASLAVNAVFAQEGLTPDVVLGHSLGEYAALAVSGALEAGDAIKLARKRGLLMESAVAAGVGGMAAVLGLDGENVERLCARCGEYGILEIANYNCPGQIVVSGERAALAQLAAEAKNCGAKKVVPLKVSGPFHSSLLREAGQKLGEALAQIEVHSPKIPLIANVNADFVTDNEAVKANLIRQVASPVLWQQSVAQMQKAGVTIAVEVGAGKVLCGLGKRIAPEIQWLYADDYESAQRVLAALR